MGSVCHGSSFTEKGAVLGTCTAAAMTEVDNVEGEKQAVRATQTKKENLSLKRLRYKTHNMIPPELV
jgi:hypothetical protein